MPKRKPALPSPQDKIAMTRRRLVGMMCPLGFWLAVVAVAFLLQYYWTSSAAERVYVRDGARRAVVAVVSSEQTASLHG